MKKMLKILVIVFATISIHEVFGFGPREHMLRFIESPEQKLFRLLNEGKLSEAKTMIEKDPSLINGKNAPLCKAAELAIFWQKSEDQASDPYDKSRRAIEKEKYKHIIVKLLDAGADPKLCNKDAQKIINSIKQQFYAPAVSQTIGGGELPTIIGEYAELTEYTPARKAADIKWEEERAAGEAEEKARQAAKQNPAKPKANPLSLDAMDLSQ